MVTTTLKSGFGRAKQRSARAHATPVTAVVKGQAKATAFRMAGVQMASGPNVAANLNEAGRLIEIAAKQGARLIALPEYFAIMG
ncbi:MAG TPA: nitrilase-related carbon-nitrogen hydrolase, partial [Burkholderiales bacterium]|nr:nitrilase-related carbon-nitrogen hydrolase [Burkholderiales bacterium]